MLERNEIVIIMYPFVEKLGGEQNERHDNLTYA